MTKTRGILLAGVGGQGILRASDILCRVFMAAGLDVKKSEVHGMAQRGGCVTSHVRFGENVHSPLAKKNDIDILVSFEWMDTLRYLDYVKESGTIIINTEEIYPPAVNLGETLYPGNITETVQGFFKKIISVDAVSMALQAGNRHTVNTVLLGTLSSCLDLPLELWKKTLNESFPKQIISINWKAFRLGRSAQALPLS
jgi:indolepyruvate ferredoxin oxidoreductase, beta subunit